ncbi:MAG: response regulator transcription factor [Clostridia bacterium]|nr:response regulator transcription factor [Clostridia bacterium]MBQ9189606.1 response regulator transcription factor [Clostridia bacterium]MBR3271590.1 response regulator transcription factor [Clostridia bacterium]
MQRILLAEDDASIVWMLGEYLRAEGYEVLHAPDEAGAVALLNAQPDLVLLDISLQSGTGYGVCREAKRRGLPVIFLTASGDENSVVEGLDMGADDYIAKPFRPRELLSRIKSVLRRAGRDSSMTLGRVSVDLDSGTVRRDGVPVALSSLEYRLLTTLLNNRGRLLPRQRLLEDIWDAGGDFVNDNTLTVYIKRLREKLEDDPQNPTLIKTVRGLGYRVD